MTERRCPHCQITYPEIEGNFYTYKTGKTPGRVSSWCKVCHDAANTERMRQRRATPKGRAVNAATVYRHRLRKDPAYLDRQAHKRAVADLIMFHREEFTELHDQHRDDLQRESQ